MFLAAAGGVAALLGVAFAGMPHFGSTFHPYRTPAVRAAVAHHTANVVSSINFDQRGFDTLGEETILLASVLGVASLLRVHHGEHVEVLADPVAEPVRGGVLEATRLLGYILLPVTLIVGIDVVAHGQLTPGGGFQGGVVLATAVHLVYVSGRYRALQRFRPLRAVEAGEAVGTIAFAGLGLATVGIGASFLADIVPLGSFGALLSGGTVPILSVAVGVEVTGGMTLLLAKFLEQALVLRGVPLPASAQEVS